MRAQWISNSAFFNIRINPPYEICIEFNANWVEFLVDLLRFNVTPIKTKQNKFKEFMTKHNL